MMSGRKAIRNSLRDAFFVVTGRKTYFATPVATAYICCMAVNGILIAVVLFNSGILDILINWVTFLRLALFLLSTLSLSLLGYDLGKNGILLASILAIAGSWLVISWFKTDASTIRILLGGPWLSLIAANLIYLAFTPIPTRTYSTPIILIMVATIVISGVLSFFPFGLSAGDFIVTSIGALLTEGFVIGMLVGQYDWLEFAPLDQPQMAASPSWNRDTILTGSDDWRFHFNKAVELFGRARMAETQSECEMARDSARKTGNLVGEALSLALLGRSKHAQGNLEEARFDLQEAYEKAKASGDVGAVANVLDAQGVYHRDVGQLDQAIEHFDNALEICHTGSSLNGIGNVSANLARTFLYRNHPGRRDLKKAEETLIKAARTLKAYPTGGFDGRIRVWQMLTLVYIEKGDLEKAMDCLEYELLLKQRVFDSPSLAIDQLSSERRATCELIPILDYLQHELVGAMRSQDVHSKIAVHFFKAKAHLQLATRVLEEQSQGFVDPVKSRLLSKDYNWHLTQAHQLLTDGIRILEDELRARVSEPETRISFLQYRLDAYDQMVLLCLTLGRPGESIEYIERAKSRVFIDQLGQGVLLSLVRMDRKLPTEIEPLRRGVPVDWEEIRTLLQPFVPGQE